MEVTIKQAETTEAPIIANLLELYMHDFSLFSNVEVGEDGRFGYAYLEHYWRDPDRFPLLILAEKKLAGFALLRIETDPGDGSKTMDLAEFFVLRQFRRQRDGSQAAAKIWDLFPGRWRLRVLVSNHTAYAFWEKLVGDYCKRKFEADDEKGFLGDLKRFSFTSGSGG